jgi:hypothetical protein
MDIMKIRYRYNIRKGKYLTSNSNLKLGMFATDLQIELFKCFNLVPVPYTGF